MRSWAPAARVLFLLALPAAAQDDSCLACHGEKGAKDEHGRSIYVDGATEKASVHASLGCQGCHAGHEG